MYEPGIRTRHSPGRKTTNALSFGGMVLERHALNAKSCGQPDPNGCHWKSTHKQAQVLAVPSNTCLPCVAHLGTPVHATSAQAHASAPTVQQQLTVRMLSVSYPCPCGQQAGPPPMERPRSTHSLREWEATRGGTISVTRHSRHVGTLRGSKFTVWCSLRPSLPPWTG